MENKADSLQIISNDSFRKNVNPNIEPALTTQVAIISINKSKQPQDLSSFTDEESEENIISPLKFSDFLLKKERNKQVMKIIQEGKEA